MTEIWLIRHGATTAPPGIAIGAGDPPLSDEGRAQAQRVMRQLAGRPLMRVVSSDSQRALSTARSIAEPHGLVVESSPDLRELDFGAWEGRALAELWSEEPRAATAWEADIRSTPATFSESVADLERRVARWWRLFRRPAVGAEVAIVAHRGSLAVLRALITGESIAIAFAAPLDHGAAVLVRTSEPEG